jgi:hypothetical protein
MMAEEQEPTADAPVEAEEQGMSQQEIERRLADLEAKIVANEFGGKPFHNVVKDEVYPLLGEQAITVDVFTRLVRKWARQNYPYDWQQRSYLEEEG